MINALKRDLKNGKQTFGIWVTISHSDVTEFLSRLPFDWFLFDQEHSPLDDQLSQQLMQAMGGTSVTPLVRVAWNDPVLIKKALDTGAHGIIVPYVNSREDAEAAVRACLYPPQGIRGFGPRRAAVLDPDYVRTANEEIFVMVQIETEEAVNNVDEILSVQGVDAFFLGPFDLAASMGSIGDPSHPRVQDAIQKVRDSGRRHGLPGGIWMGAGAPLEQRIREGWQFICLGMDVSLLMDGASAALASAKLPEA